MNMVNDLTKEINVPTHLVDVENIMYALMQFHAAREATYGMSFAKRGEIGVWMNLMRKCDRIDNQVRAMYSQPDGVPGAPGTALVDTLMDLALYAMKWAAIIKHVRPDDLKKWIEETYMRDVPECTKDDAYRLFGFLKEYNFEQIAKAKSVPPESDYLSVLKSYARLLDGYSPSAPMSLFNGGDVDAVVTTTFNLGALGNVAVGEVGEFEEPEVGGQLQYRDPDQKNARELLDYLISMQGYYLDEAQKGRLHQLFRRACVDPLDDLHDVFGELQQLEEYVERRRSMYR